MSSTVQKIISIMSFILHPIFLPPALMIWYFYASPTFLTTPYCHFLSSELKMKWLFLYISLTTIIPVFIFIWAKVLGTVQSFSHIGTDERKHIFLILGIYYWAVYYTMDNIFFQDFWRPSVLIMAATAILILVLSLLNALNFNASLHTAGYGLVTAFFVVCAFIFHDNYFNEIIFSILLSTFVMIIRLLANAHNFLEMFAGWIIGILSCIIPFLIEYHYFS